MKCQSIILVIFLGCTCSSIQKELKEEEIDISKYAEMASSFLKEQNAESVAGLISNFIQNDGGKQLGDMLLNVGQKNAAKQVLQGVDSLLNQGGSDQNNRGFDPAILGTVINFLSGMNTAGDKKSDDSSGIFSLLGNVLQREGVGIEDVVQYLPMLYSTFASFTGEEAKKREAEHSGHSWILPPILEYIHIAFDHFMHSDLGKMLLQKLGTEKFVKVFSDSKGNFDLNKCMELLENHSFRKHWIHMVTKRVAKTIAHFADPNVQKKFLTSGQYLINSLLKSYGFPKNTYFDSTRPSETLTAFVNYLFKHYFNYKINAKEYVQPAVKYVQELIQISQQCGFFTGGEGIDASELSDKLADTINLEIIEPGARVYRAYRFAKKHPKCDRYIMCLINQHTENEKLSLPGLKQGLTMSASMVASWFLSSHTQTPFQSLYNIITGETNCKAYFLEECNYNFYKEELKVTTEYVHNEL